MGCQASTAVCPSQVCRAQKSPSPVEESCKAFLNADTSVQEKIHQSLLVMMPESDKSKIFCQASSKFDSKTHSSPAKLKSNQIQHKETAATAIDYITVLGSNELPKHNSFIIKGKGRSKQGSERFSVDTPPNFPATPMAGKQG